MRIKRLHVNEGFSAVVLSWARFCPPQRHLGNCLETFCFVLFLLSKLGWGGLLLASAAKHPTMHRTAPTKSYPAQKVGSATHEKPCTGAVPGTQKGLPLCLLLVLFYKWSFLTDAWSHTVWNWGHTQWLRTLGLQSESVGLKLSLTVYYQCDFKHITWLLSTSNSLL